MSDPAPDMAAGENRPPGSVSTIRGVRQIPALTAVVRAVGLLAIVGSLAPGSVGTAGAIGAVVVVTATPLARVAWLMIRWRQEGDGAFVLRGAALLAVVATGAALAFLTS